MDGSLPLEIVWEIFSRYQEGENAFYPLETLLLVCKRWSSAALSNRALWARYKIRMGHEPIMKMWRARLPLRIARSGEVTLVDIDINTDIGGENNVSCYARGCVGDTGYKRSFWLCRCDREHESFIIWALGLLAGLDGAGCRRWRKVRFHTDKYFMDYGPLSASRSLFRALAFPTPSLVSLSLHRISSNHLPGRDCPFLPFAPMLQEVVLSECCLSRPLPAMNGLRRIELSEVRHWDTNLVRLGELEEVEQLVLNNLEVELPMNLPRLRHLTLTGWRVKLNIERVSMPRLTYLSLDPGDFELWAYVTERHPLLFEQLKHLEIRGELQSSPRLGSKQHEDSVSRLICSFESLLSVSASVSFFGALLKWMSQGRSTSGELEDERVKVKWKQGVALILPSGELMGELSSDGALTRTGVYWPSMTKPNRIE